MDQLAFTRDAGQRQIGGLRLPAGKGLSGNGRQGRPGGLRVQRERMSGGFFPTAREYSRRYGLDGRRMATLADHTIVMHPGPMVRGMEITADVADSDRSVIVEQVTNGVAVRMAVLYLLLSGADADNDTEGIDA